MSPLTAPDRQHGDAGTGGSAISSRVDIFTARADQLVPQSTALAAATRVGPAMLGAVGPRRYFVAHDDPVLRRSVLTIDGISAWCWW